MPVAETKADRQIPDTGGFVVVHASKRNAFEVVIDLNRPYNGPDSLRTIPCPTCNVIHHHKTYHIMLDAQGRNVVSPGVYRGLRHAGMGDLQVETHTKTPPDQVLGTRSGMMGLTTVVKPLPTIYTKDLSEE